MRARIGSIESPPVHAGGPSTPGALIRNWIGSREHRGLEERAVPCSAVNYNG